MNKIEIYKKIQELIGECEILLDEPMSKHTSFKIGGPVDIMVIPNSIDEIQKTIKVCKENNISYFIMGNGSNLIVKDKGIRSVIIKIGEKFKDIRINDNIIIAECGILLSSLSKRAMAKGLKGLEFASGIPGTLGGGLTMNAGAYGGEMKHIVKSAKVMDRSGNIKELTIEELQLGYRTSIIQAEEYIALEVTIELEKGDIEEIKSITNEITKERTTKQPLHLPSAGSVFKRPEGYYAGKLIQDSGLKGKRVGGAAVSDLHCGFIVNLGNATANDVLNLISLIQNTVKEKFGVELSTEVKVIGED